MANYMPSAPFNVPVHLLKVVGSSVVKGVPVNTYEQPTNDNIIYCSLKTYGGTETTVNGVLTVIDTAYVETWYRPDITANCRICKSDNPSEVYEIMGRPENINNRNQFTKFKVKAVTGGA